MELETREDPLKSYVAPIPALSGNPLTNLGPHPDTVENFSQRTRPSRFDDLSNPYGQELLSPYGANPSQLQTIGDPLSDLHRPQALESAPPNPHLIAEYPEFLDYLEGTDSIAEDSKPRHRVSDKPHSSQRRSNRDEFDGPVQFLEKPPLEKVAAQERDLPHVPINLDVREQDGVLRQVNSQLSQCAYDFVAKYQFPIPLEPDKRPVQKPNDREWTEWAYLIKRLATKRRIPARVLYNGQIKQLVTVLENSLEMRHASAHQSRPPKDDRNILQLISAGTQVAKMLKDAIVMEYMDHLYQSTERLIQGRRQAPNPYMT